VGTDETTRVHRRISDSERNAHGQTAHASSVGHSCQRKKESIDQIEMAFIKLNRPEGEKAAGFLEKGKGDAWRELPRQKTHTGVCEKVQGGREA